MNADNPDDVIDEADDAELDEFLARRRHQREKGRKAFRKAVVLTLTPLVLAALCVWAWGAACEKVRRVQNQSASEKNP